MYIEVMTEQGYRYEHRVIAEQTLGRPLVQGEVVHHINGNTQDNRPENLEVLRNGEHVARHGRQLPRERFVEMGRKGGKARHAP